MSKKQKTRTKFKTLVRADAEGIFVRADGRVFRPGRILGYDHAYEMDAGGLKAGDHVAARHMSGTELVVIRYGKNQERVWGSQYEHDKMVTMLADPKFIYSNTIH